MPVLQKRKTEPYKFVSLIFYNTKLSGMLLGQNVASVVLQLTDCEYCKHLKMVGTIILIFFICYIGKVCCECSFNVNPERT